MKKRSLIAIPLVVGFIVSIAWLWLSPSGISQAPDIKFTITDGSIIDLKELQGKPVLVTFWATSCIGCVR